MRRALTRVVGRRVHHLVEVRRWQVVLVVDAEVVHAQHDLLEIVHALRPTCGLAADWTAGKSIAISTAMIEIATSNSMSVKPRRVDVVAMRLPPRDKVPIVRAAKEKGHRSAHSFASGAHKQSPGRAGGTGRWRLDLVHNRGSLAQRAGNSNPIAESACPDYSGAAVPAGLCPAWSEGEHRSRHHMSFVPAKCRIGMGGLRRIAVTGRVARTELHVVPFGKRDIGSLIGHCIAEHRGPEA